MESTLFAEQCAIIVGKVLSLKFLSLVVRVARAVPNIHIGACIVGIMVEDFHIAILAT